jgi:hypothetical protein
MRFYGHFLGVLLACLPLGATADTTSEVIFSRKAWQVEIVGFDDGSIACVAQVTRPRATFSIWAFEDESVRLQFFSDEWEFEESTANLEIQVDRRGPWTLTNAELFQNSVLFDLPDSKDGVRLMVEVAAGNTLFLRDEDGADVRRFPLAGSKASMLAMVECGETISQGGGGGGSAKRKSNPFN